MQATPIYCPSIMRAAIVRSYAEQLVKDNRAKRPRHLSFEAAMRVRAEWITGVSTKELAARLFEGRLDSATELVSGLTYVSCTVEECATHDSIMAAFWGALDACAFAPVGSEAESYVLPLQRFAQGDYRPMARGEVAVREEKVGPKEVPALETSVKARPIRAVLDALDAPAPPSEEGWLGLVLYPYGPMVRNVVPGGPAAEAGLRHLDEFEEIDGVKIGTGPKGREKLVEVLSAARPGQTMRVLKSRDDGPAGLVFLTVGVKPQE